MTVSTRPENGRFWGDLHFVTKPSDTAFSAARLAAAFELTIGHPPIFSRGEPLGVCPCSSFAGSPGERGVLLRNIS